MRLLSSFVVIVLAVAAVISFTTPAVAQTEDAHAILDAAPKIATSVQGVHAFPAPPKDFDPFAASNVELLTIGLPQRPDQATNARAYAIWERGMLALKIHPDGVQEAPTSSHRMVPAGPSSSANVRGTVSTGSYNWSGIATTNTLKKWNNSTSFTQVESIFNVPVAKPPFGSVPCSDGPWEEVSWNGIGGYLEESLVQGGSSESWNGGGCKGSIQYAGWVEWVPSYAMLDILCGSKLCPVSPGDDFWVITYGAAGTVEQYVFVEDVTQQWGGTYGMTWKSGNGLIGTTAEYIVERPCCMGSNFYPLMNYIYDFFDYNFAYNGAGKVFYPGSTGASTTIFTMYADDDATPISIPIGYGTSGFEGLHSIFFEDENCTYKGGCKP